MATITHPALVGYGGSTEQLISLSVIVVGLASFFYALVIQDRQRRGLLRDRAPVTAHASAATGTPPR